MTIPIPEKEQVLFSEYIQKVTGIQIDASKNYLLTSRLDHLVQEFGSYASLWEALQKDSTRILENKIIDAISTNETFFFRDPKTFDLLRYKVIPDHFNESSTRPFSVLSAASSTGQEAYSVSMVLKELLFDLTKYNIKIHGTDISPAAVDNANHGEYTSFEVSRGLDQKQIDRYFVRTANRYRICDELRSVCRFKVDNLLAPSTLHQQYDLILCRNVLIYFSAADRQKVYGAMRNYLTDNGIFIIGGTESLMQETSLFKREEFRQATYYVIAK